MLDDTADCRTIAGKAGKMKNRFSKKSLDCSAIPGYVGIRARGPDPCTSPPLPPRRPPALLSRRAHERHISISNATKSGLTRTFQGNGFVFALPQVAGRWLYTSPSGEQSKFTIAQLTGQCNMTVSGACDGCGPGPSGTPPGWTSSAGTVSMTNVSMMLRATAWAR